MVYSQLQQMHKRRLTYYVITCSEKIIILLTLFQTVKQIQLLFKTFFSNIQRNIEKDLK